MAIFVACPCGQDIWAENHYANKRVRCPKCREPILIPNPEEAAEAKVIDDDGVEEGGSYQLDMSDRNPGRLPTQAAQVSGLLGAFSLGRAGTVTGLAWAPDCSYALAGLGHLVNKLDIRTGKHFYELKAHVDTVLATAVSPDNVHAASADRAGNVLIWDMEEMRGLRWLAGHDGPVYDVAFAPSGAYLATAGGDGTARFWEVATGKQLARLREDQGAITCLAFSPDGERVVTGSSDGFVSMWDVQRVKMVQDLKSNPLGRVLSVAFDQAGDQVMAAGRRGRGTVLCRWHRSYRDGRLRYRAPDYLEGFRPCHGAAFSPCGSRCFTGGAPAMEYDAARQVEVWFSPVFVVGLETGATTRAFAAHVQERAWVVQGIPVPEVTSLAISDDGLRGLAGHSDATVCVWGLY